MDPAEFKRLEAKDAVEHGKRVCTPKVKSYCITKDTP